MYLVATAAPFFHVCCIIERYRSVYRSHVELLHAKHGTKYCSYHTCSEFDFKPIGHKSGIRKKGPSMQIRVLLLHVAQNLSILSSPKTSRKWRKTYNVNVDQIKDSLHI